MKYNDPCLESRERRVAWFRRVWFAYLPLWAILLGSLPMWYSLRLFWHGAPSHIDTHLIPKGLDWSKLPMAEDPAAARAKAAKEAKPAHSPVTGIKNIGTAEALAPTAATVGAPAHGQEGAKADSTCQGRTAPPRLETWPRLLQERTVLLRFRVAVGLVGVASMVAMLVSCASMVGRQTVMVLLALTVGGAVGLGRAKYDDREDRESAPDSVIRKIFENRCGLAYPKGQVPEAKMADYAKTILEQASQLTLWTRKAVSHSMAMAMVGLAFVVVGFCSLMIKLNEVTNLDEIKDRVRRLRQMMFAGSLLLVAGVACASSMHDWLFFSIRDRMGVAEYIATLNLRTGIQYSALLALAYWATLLPLQWRAEKILAIPLPLAPPPVPLPAPPAGGPPPANSAATPAPAPASPPPGAPPAAALADADLGFVDWKAMLPRLLALLAPLLAEPVLKLLETALFN